MNFTDISIIATILAVVANMVIGALWYSPLLFSNIWVKALGKKMEDIDPKGANVGYALTTLGGIITAIILSLFIHLLDNVTILDGAFIGFLVGLVAAFRELSPTFFESRKYTLFFISAGYHIFSLTIMGIIIAAFAS
ncbi:DUF1761 domain-containing protein [Neobacillus drentensis]|jgi:hypothetical protein|uniref:DUF1761 domain-containing protein n=1 Tax=Neobacillus drentensis TaxID=220684 RepID=UPI002FFDD10A